MKVALITGAARGIGQACAQRLAADGFRVLIADRGGAKQAAAEIDGAHPYAADLADPEQTLVLAGRILTEHGRCDVLVNNAAQLGRHTLEQLDLETFRRFERVNVEAPLAAEWGDRNITVNAVAPGLTRTPATDADMPDNAFSEVRAAQALDRELRPADIAGAVGYLASEAAAAVTGQAIRVDAGLVRRGVAASRTS